MLEYVNIGAKIKNASKTISSIGIIFSIVFGGIIFVYGASERHMQFLMVVGIVIAIVSSIIWWLIGLLFTAFGQLVENSDFIAAQVKQDSITRYNIANNLYKMCESLKNNKNAGE